MSSYELDCSSADYKRIMLRIQNAYRQALFLLRPALSMTLQTGHTTTSSTLCHLTHANCCRKNGVGQRAEAVVARKHVVCQRADGPSQQRKCCLPTQGRSDP